ncbi:MAG TPA: glycoside hydrolase family 2 TIM barrel-domain containing protein, partial [Chryseosolibacter sp.]
GIRSVEIKGTSLLLNGEPVKMGGCNRPLDHPDYGSLDPQQVLQEDFNLMKRGSMELSRLSHYPVSSELLDLADMRGILIIAEAGNWQMTPAQMSDSSMRRKFQNQFREMIERDWNHPSVIAWSVGNEYQSQTTEGKDWTKDMFHFAKSLDPQRLVTFSSMIVFRDFIKSPSDEASQYVDFISANIYGNHRENLQRIHALYPDKPIYVSEFGLRADQVTSEVERVRYLSNAMADFRQCEYLIGASIWTLNDYKSMYPGTNANGFRPWGLVDQQRKPRDMYHAWQSELAPATLQLLPVTTGRLRLVVTARKDFPSYTLRNYTVRVNATSFAVGILKPGESKSFEIDGVNPDGYDVELIKPGGFLIYKRMFSKDGTVTQK